LATDFSFKFDRSRFENPAIMDRKINRALYGVCKYWDGPVERHMKQNAPWKDRTSNARNGLTAFAAKLGGRGFDSNTFAIILAHGVDYGIYLEAKPEDDGGRPIILPTIRLYAPKVMKTLTKLMRRLGGGA
jgi:hypothetical protein